MSVEFSEVLRMHDEAWTSSQTVRERAADDLLFARVTQWDDPYLETQLEYRGQFDMIRKARRQNLSEMRANPVQVSYIAGRDADDDTADVLERKYRFDMSTPGAKQAAIIAQQDQIDCGLGAWRLVTDYENSAANEQYIKREPIHEANNVIFRDPNCVMPDGSDARYLSVVWSITALGWPAFAKSIGVSEDLPNSFRPPEDSNVFPWAYQDKTFNVSEFYYREEVTRVAYLFENNLGEEKLVKEEDVDDIMDELMDEQYGFIEEREYQTFQVRKYWVAGGGFLNGEDGEEIPGTEIPVVILFGEVSKVETQWVWEGIVRLAKDPQRLRNFMLSYIADIAAKGARQRPYFRMSQIQGLEWQFEEGGPDDNKPFRVLNDVDDDGNPLEGGPVAYEQPPEMPPAAAGLLQEANQAIDDVTQPGIPQDVASSDLSGKAVMAMQNQVDMTNYSYLDNYGMALQREAEIYATMVPEVYDTPRSIGLLSDDGTEEIEAINNYMFDGESGKFIMAMDLTKGEYRVRTKVQPGYQTRRDQQKAQKIELYSASEGNPEAQNVLLMELMMLDDGDSSEVSAKYARQNLLRMGLMEPESQEDEEFMAAEEAAQAEEKPDPMMIAAEAEMQKAQADLQEAKNKEQGVMVDKMNADTNRFKAETDRLTAQIKAKEAGVSVQVKGLEAQGMKIANAAAIQDMQNTEREVAYNPATGGFA